MAEIDVQCQSFLLFLSKWNVNRSYSLNHRGNVFISLPSFACIWHVQLRLGLCAQMAMLTFFLMTVSVMTQQSLALYPNGDVAIFLTTVWVMTQQSLALSQMEVFPFCKHLYQWGHHIIFCSVPIRRCYIQDLFTVYLYSPVTWRYTWAHRKHTACNDVCPQQLWSTSHRDRHNMVDIHISSYSRFHPIEMM